MDKVKEFFGLANWSIRKIHDDILNDIISSFDNGHKIKVFEPEDEAECILKMKNYGHTVTIGSTASFCIPYPTPQGYFIIEGKKKVVVFQERKDSSQIVVFKEDDYFKCSIRRHNNKEIETLEIRGLMQETFIKSLEMRIGSMITFSSSGAKQKTWVSAFSFMNICVENWMDKMLQCSSNVNTMRIKTALKELEILFDDETSTDKLDVLGEMFSKECLSNCTKESRNWTVCFALTKVIETMIGVRPIDDIDELMFKRILTPAHLIQYSIFFAQSKEAELRSLTDRFRRGAWRTAYGASVEGVSQTLSSRSELDELSHVRRISIPLDVHAANVSVRQIRRSQIGFVCPCETPEGKEVGIVKYLALTSFVTPETKALEMILSQQIQDKGRPYTQAPWGVKGMGPPEGRGQTKFIFLNNVIVDSVDNASQFVYNLRKERKKNNALKFVSIYEDEEGHVRILSDSGRLCRPLFDKDGDIVYIDVAEQFHSVLFSSAVGTVKQSKQVLAEIHPSFVFGVSASIIPFINHNQSPRAVFQSSMNKQALCTLTKPLKWTEGEKKTLDYAQKPFCYTMTSPLFNSLNGVNVYIAILSYTGYNQEDAIIVSKSAVDRGLFSNTRYDTIEIVENRLLQEKMVRHSPLRKKQIFYEENFVLKERKKDMYDDEGIILPGREVKKGDVIAVKFNTNLLRKEEISELFEYTLAPDDCVVHSVEKTRTNFSRIIRITFKKSKKPIVGDKLTSRHSQKGVIGRIMANEDMPFDENGSCPDLIINPHAIPSRMTVGQLIEMALSLDCSFHNGTAFIKTEDIPFSSKTLYCGITGNVMECEVAVGFCYYMTLIHQAEEKAFSRSEETVQVISKQPTEGRAKGGGLRFGEMEKDCLIAHGASETLIEKLMDDSDPIDVFICTNNTCVMFGATTASENICNKCHAKTTKKKIPYSLHLLSQQLLMAGMKMSLSDN